LVYAHYPDLPPATKVISFDMDSTLIEPLGKGKFPANRTDWHWWHECVPTRLKTLNAEGFRIVIFTNQNGISKGHQKQGDITGKILDLSDELGFPLQAFIATTDDSYRKPSTLMWDFFVNTINSKVIPTESLYVGDAAGRPNNWKSGKKKDFSCSDRKFANNIGIPFKTPEEFFLSEDPFPTFIWDAIDPKEVLSNAPKELFTGGGPLTSSTQELILLVGFPASGKSTFSKRYLIPQGYVHINRDTLKTQPKCLKALREALSAGKSAVVDNTNPSVASRGEYIKIASDSGIPVRCYHLQTSYELAEHLNLFRERITNGESKHVPGVGFNMFRSKFEEPKLSEGFTEIKKINFVPQFDDASTEGIFKQFT